MSSPRGELLALPEHGGEQVALRLEARHDAVEPHDEPGRARQHRLRQVARAGPTQAAPG